jgi:ATP-dependent DNA helicase RecQ
MQSEHLCRTKILCAYFGDKYTEDCMVCDVCLKRKKLGLEEAKYARITERIIEQLAYKEQSVSNLRKALPEEKEGDIIQCIQWLLETRVIIQDDTGKLVWQKKTN